MGMTGKTKPLPILFPKFSVDTSLSDANTDRASKNEVALQLCARQCTKFVGAAHTHRVSHSVSNLSPTFLWQKSKARVRGYKTSTETG